MSRASEARYRVWCVLFDLDGPGRFGDGLEWRRFSREDRARAFAAAHTCYRQPAAAVEEVVRRELAHRWGCSDAQRVRA